MTDGAFQQPKQRYDSHLPAATLEPNIVPSNALYSEEDTRYVNIMNSSDFKTPPETQSLRSLKIDWEGRVEMLRGVTYLTLDDAVKCMADTLLEEIGLAQGGPQVERTLLALIYEDEPLLQYILNTLNIAHPDDHPSCSNSGIVKKRC
jgi:hypothetical protein